MTELYIDGQLVVLPKSFSITIIEENPFFTKNGKYSYDITLSLLDPINAKIYKHLNRLNNKIILPENRTAYLVVDNEVVLNGTEVILEHTDKEVKIQLVSGNSELNFLIGGDRNLRDLELGEMTKYESNASYSIAEQVLSDLGKGYPERNWQLLPYSAGYEDINIGSPTWRLHVGNDFSIYNYHNMPSYPEDETGLPIYLGSYSGQIAQPYFCFIIKRILEYLGYNLVYNVLEEDPILSQLYIVHGFRTKYFAKMLPNWTVNEFFTELETWLDVTTVINPHNKTVRIMFNYQEVRDEQTENILIEEIDILDKFVVECNDENEDRVQSSNVAYSLGSDDYYKFMDIGSTIRDVYNETNESEDLIFLDIQSLLDHVLSKPFEETKSKIYKVRVGEFEDKFIAYLSDSTKPEKISIRKIDSFAPLFNKSDIQSKDIDIEFKIIPASFVCSFINTKSQDGESISRFWVQVPVAENFDVLNEKIDTEEEPEEEEGFSISNIQEMIESGDSLKEKLGGDKLQLAIYTGLKLMSVNEIIDGRIKKAYYPMAWVENLYEDLPMSNNINYIYEDNTFYNPLRLSEIDEKIYSKSQRTDTNRTYKLSFVNKSSKNIAAIFIANNKEFRCLKIERVLTEKGFDRVAKGEFYPRQDNEVVG